MAIHVGIFVEPVAAINQYVCSAGHRDDGRGERCDDPDNDERFLRVSDDQVLSSAVVDSVSLERALKDVEAANARVIALTRQLLEREQHVSALESEVVQLKRLLDPRRKMEHVFRKNHSLYVIGRQAKRMMGR